MANLGHDARIMRSRMPNPIEQALIHSDRIGQTGSQVRWRNHLTNNACPYAVRRALKENVRYFRIILIPNELKHERASTQLSPCNWKP